MFDEDEICPLCGREFSFKRDEWASATKPEYRDDAVVCKSTPVGGLRTAFIHFPDDEVED